MSLPSSSSLSNCRRTTLHHTLYRIPCLTTTCRYLNTWKISGDYNPTTSYDFDTPEGRSLKCRRCSSALEAWKRHNIKFEVARGKRWKEGTGFSLWVRTWECWACGYEMNGVLGEACQGCGYRRDGACLLGWWR